MNQRVSIEGQLEDYVNLIEALLCVYDLTGKYNYLQQANLLMNKCLEEFWDSQKRILYLSPSNQVGPQLTRSLRATDGAILSPISAAIGCLYKLHNRSALFESEIDYKRTAEKLLDSINSSLTTDLHRFVYALGIKEIGLETSKNLSKYFTNLNSIQVAKYNDFIQVDDVGEVAATNLENFFSNIDNKKIINEFLKLGLKLRVNRLTRL